MSKLGIFIQHWNDQARHFLMQARPRVVKWMEFPTDGLQFVRSYGGINIARVDPPGPDPLALVQTILSHAAVYGKYIDYYELWNEPADALNALNEKTIRVYQYLEQQPHPPKLLIGNFSEGNPDLAAWPDFYPAMRYAIRKGGALALHEYGAPTMRECTPWHVLRYRLAYESFPEDLRALPLFVTECGIDGGVIGQKAKGWQGFGDEGHYLADLRWYDQTLAEDNTQPSVIGATIFLCGYFDPWQSFDVAACTHIANYIAQDNHVVTDFSSPNHDGPRPQTLGVVLHSTRGGAASLAAEYASTIAWFDNPASAVSAHAVIGPGGQVHRPVDPTLIAWHAREYNQHHLGIELCQAKAGDRLDPTILESAAQVVAGWHHQFGFPLQLDLMNGLAEHWQIPPGVRDGKSDIKPPFDAAAFCARVKQIVEETKKIYAVGPGVLAKMASVGDSPLSDEHYLGQDLSFTAGGKGLYLYVPQANRTYFLADAKA